MSKEKVIILLCDTLRAKSLPQYGSERETTPNLRGIIDEHFTVFSRAYAPAPWTTPSHLSLFTGLYPSQVMETSTSFNLDPIFMSMPEIFKDSGYRTFACSTNTILCRKTGFDRGFDLFNQLWLPDPSGDDISLRLEGESRFEKLVTLFRRLARKDMRPETVKGMIGYIYKKHRNILDDATPSTNRSMALLKKHMVENTDERTFFFLNIMQAHNRYHPPKITRNRFGDNNAALEGYYKERIPLEHYAVEPFSKELLDYMNLRYDEEILYLDIVIADLISFLQREGLFDSSTIIITSDHGEHFGENGHAEHHFSLFEPLIRIPMFIKWSGRSDNRGSVNDRLVMLQDLYSTFINKLDHWHPQPYSSIDLTSVEERPWVLSQLPDISHDVKVCFEKNPAFSIQSLGMESTALSAFVYPDGKKVIENGESLICFDLNNDPEEVAPLAVPDERKQEIADIKGAL